MGRIIQPLREMGAAIESGERGLPPLMIRGGNLKAIRYRPRSQAQVNHACVCRALCGRPHSCGESVPTRDHTEEALKEFGGTVRISGTGLKIRNLG
jgi:3-phosphoshikimate 1-carboxyvinyltransferase